MTASVHYKTYDIFNYDVIIVGAGPAGFAAAHAADKYGARTLLIDREENPDWKQCINDGYDCEKSGNNYTGQEYNHGFTSLISNSGIQIAANTFVSKIEKLKTGFSLKLVSRDEIKNIKCKSLVLGCGCRELVRENEIAENLGVPFDACTHRPIVDQNCMTMLDGVFCCGKAMHVNDPADYVSESGNIAGKAAAQWVAFKNQERNMLYNHNDLIPDERFFTDITANENFLYIVPQKININNHNKKTIVYFRSKNEMCNSILTVSLDGNEIYKRIYPFLRPPETERIELDIKNMDINQTSTINISLAPAVIH